MLKKLILAAIAVAAAAPMASAADLPAPPAEADSGWSFTFAPYLWAAGMDGKVAQFGLPEVEVDASFSDVLNHLDIGLMGAGEARNGRFAVATDLLWVKLSADQDTPLGVLANKVDADIETLMFTAVGSYSLFLGETGNLDVVAGGRVWSVDTELDFKGGILGGQTASDDATWVDPVVGLKGRANFTPEFYITGWGLIGGFDVSSKFMWDVMGGLGYAPSDGFSIVAGYRGVGVDYRNDGFVYDVVQHGPMLGFVFNF